jgi:hypothetical protein
LLNTFMSLTFYQLIHKLHEEAPAPAAPGGAATPPPPPPPGGDPMAGGADPMAGGGMPPPPGGDAMGGAAPGAPPAGKPKIIKITTVWDALENALGGKAQEPKNKQHPPEKQAQPPAPKSLYT